MVSLKDNRVTTGNGHTRRNSRPAATEQLVGARQGDGFWWCVGIEGTTIPQMRVDEYEWCQHDRFWREDLDRIRGELGVSWLRYPIPWYKVNPSKNTFDWSWTDEKLQYAVKIGLTPLVDLVHFGTPEWLNKQFADDNYPNALEAYAKAFAKRYGSLIQYYCPTNEPLITALFGADLGHWPPHLHTPYNYTHVLTKIAKAEIMARRAIEKIVPDALVTHIDTTEYYATSDPRLKGECETRNLRRFVFFDIISGRINRHHPFYGWLHNYGMLDSDLDWFEKHSVEFKLLGLDYYPQSESWLHMESWGIRQDKANGLTTLDDYTQTRDYRKVDTMGSRPLGLYGMLKQYQERYNCPIFVAETDYCGSVAERETWLNYTLDSIRGLREDGIPVVGYTWWGANDHLNWDLALTERNNIHPVGLWQLEREPGTTTMRRVHTRMVDAYRNCVQNSAERIGDVAAVQREAVKPALTKS